MPTHLSPFECGVQTDIDVPHIRVPQAFANDMDRTMFRTASYAQHLGQTAADFGVDPNVIRQAQLAAEAVPGQSFDPMKYVEDALSPEMFAQFGQVLLESDPGDLAYPDALPYVAQLSATGTPNIIPTYGQSIVGQLTKARLGGFGCYVEVMEDSDKGNRVESWRGPQGTFDFYARDRDGYLLAVLHADTVCVVDDRPSSFDNLPADCVGEHVTRPYERDHGQLSSAVTSRVRPVTGLGGATVLRAATVAGCSHAIRSEVSEPMHSFEPVRSAGLGVVVSRSMSFAELQYRAANLADAKLPLTM